MSNQRSRTTDSTQTSMVFGCTGSVYTDLLKSVFFLLCFLSMTDNGSYITHHHTLNPTFPRTLCFCASSPAQTIFEFYWTHISAQSHRRRRQRCRGGVFTYIRPVRRCTPAAVCACVFTRNKLKLFNWQPHSADFEDKHGGSSRDRKAK